MYPGGQPGGECHTLEHTYSSLTNLLVPRDAWRETLGAKLTETWDCPFSSSETQGRRQSQNGREKIRRAKVRKKNNE